VFNDPVDCKTCCKDPADPADPLVPVLEGIMDSDADLAPMSGTILMLEANDPVI